MTNIEKMIKEGMNAADIDIAWCQNFRSCKECPFREFHEDCEELVKIYEWLLQEATESEITETTISVVDVRPTVGEPNVIYFVPNEEAKPENVYDEWVYPNNSWEHIGNTKIDLELHRLKYKQFLQQTILNEADK